MLKYVYAVIFVILSSTNCWAKTHRVIIKDMEFSPQHISIAVGDKVEWVNNDSFDHTATTQDKKIDVHLPANTKRNFVFKRAGKFPYLCIYHPNMTGDIEVLSPKP